MGARARALGVMAPWWWLEPRPHNVSTNVSSPHDCEQ